MKEKQFEEKIEYKIKYIRISTIYCFSISYLNVDNIRDNIHTITLR